MEEKKKMMIDSFDKLREEVKKYLQEVLDEEGRITIDSTKDSIFNILEYFRREEIYIDFQSLNLKMIYYTVEETIDEFNEEKSQPRKELIEYAKEHVLGRSFLVYDENDYFPNEPGTMFIDIVHYDSIENEDYCDLNQVFLNGEIASLTLNDNPVIDYREYRPLLTSVVEEDDNGELSLNPYYCTKEISNEDYTKLKEMYLNCYNEMEKIAYSLIKG